MTKRTIITILMSITVGLVLGVFTTILLVYFGAWELVLFLLPIPVFVFGLIGWLISKKRKIAFVNLIILMAIPGIVALLFYVLSEPLCLKSSYYTVIETYSGETIAEVLAQAPRCKKESVGILGDTSDWPILESIVLPKDIYKFDSYKYICCGFESGHSLRAHYKKLTPSPLMTDQAFVNRNPQFITTGRSVCTSDREYGLSLVENDTELFISLNIHCYF